jgi:hypothetical protein
MPAPNGPTEEAVSLHISEDGPPDRFNLRIGCHVVLREYRMRSNECPILSRPPQPCKASGMRNLQEPALRLHPVQQRHIEVVQVTGLGVFLKSFGIYSPYTER